MSKIVTRSPITIGDITYDASPLNDESRDALDEWVRMKYADRMAPLMNQLSGPALDSMVKHIASELPTISFVSPVGVKFLNTVDGWGRVLYEMIRVNHPDVTYEDLCKEMMDPANLRKANTKFRELEQLNKQEPVPAGKQQDPSH